MPGVEAREGEERKGFFVSLFTVCIILPAVRCRWRKIGDRAALAETGWGRMPASTKNPERSTGFF
jgi:hypothetical protein